MKKLSLIICFASLVVGCGNKNHNGDHNSEEEPSHSTIKPTANKPKRQPSVLKPETSSLALLAALEKSGLSREEVATWEKTGFQVGWMLPHVEDVNHSFSTSLDGVDATRAVPAFKVSRFGSVVATETWNTLPIPNGGFGLDLTLTQATDANLKEVAKFQQLTKLYLFGCSQITDTGLKEVANLKKLTSLNLGGTKITDAGLKELAQLEHLSELNLYSCQITDVGLKEVARLKKLISLGLDGTKITDAGLKELVQLEQLTGLNLFGCKKITNVGLKEIAKLHKLTLLDMAGPFGNGAQITDAGLKDLAKLQQLTRLGLPRFITDAGLQDLAQLKQLAELNLFGCRQITDVGLQNLAQLQKLSSLDLRGCKQVTGAGLAELKKALPNCTISR